MKKTCRTCGEAKSVDDFGCSKSYKDGRNTQCKVCFSARYSYNYERVNQGVDRTCGHCEQTFYDAPHRGVPRKFCSDLCCHTFHRLARRDKLREWVCRDCGNPAPSNRYKCDACRSRTRTKEYNEAKNLRQTLRRFGLSMDEWTRMLTAQRGRCAICRTDKPGGRSERWHIDHDHVTDQVRGLLCNNCNLGIGLLGDDPDRIKCASAYVAKHRQLELQLVV